MNCNPKSYNFFYNHIDGLKKITKIIAKESVNMLYKIYGKTSKSWKLIGTKKSKNEVQKFIKEVASMLYPNILVVRQNNIKQIDEVVDIFFQKEQLDYFKIYGSTKEDWYYLGNIYHQKGLKKLLSYIDKEQYDRIMVIHYDPILNSDELYMMQYLNTGISRIRKQD